MQNYGGHDGEPNSAFDLMAFGAKIWGTLALRIADVDVLPFDHEEQAVALSKYCDAVDGNGLELDELRAAVARYETAAAALNELKTDAACVADAECLNELNEKLAFTERRFLNPDGLPGRPWFRHTLQAPGLYLGYAAEAFPGVQQALDDGDVDTAAQQVAVLVERVTEAAEFMEK